MKGLHKAPEDAARANLAVHHRADLFDTWG